MLLPRILVLLVIVTLTQACIAAPAAESVATSPLDSYRASAEMGDMDAVYKLAQAYRFGTDGVDIDYAQALDYFRLGLRNQPDREEFRVELWEMYQQGGDAVAEARKQAESLLLRDAGNNQKAHDYYALYLINWNSPKVRRIYQAKAAELGHSVAAYHAAHHYRYGWSVESDLLKAIYFYELAAKKGHSYSQDALKELSTDPQVIEHYTPKDIARFKNYRKNYRAEARAAAVANLKLVKEAYDRGDESRANAILDEGLAKWRARSTDKEDYTLSTANQLPVRADRSRITHRLDWVEEDDFICANTMSAMEYLAQERLAVGDWESAMFYAAWMERWIQHIEASGQKPKRNFPGYHAVVHEDAYFTRANVFAALGLIEEEAEDYEFILGKAYKNYKWRGYQRATYKLAGIRLQQGRGDEIDLLSLEANEAKVKSNRFVESHEWQFSKLVRARVSAQREDPSLGFALVDEVLAATSERTLPLLRLEALLVAAELTMDAENYDQVEPWLVEALTWARSQGLLLEELRVYELYVRYLIATENYELALEVQQRILELIDTLNLTPRETEALIQLAQIYSLLNDRESALAVVDHLGRGKFDPSWLVTLDSKPTDSVAVSEQRGSISLQPLRMVSAPITETGQTIFTLSNPTPQSLNLQMQIKSKQFSVVTTTPTVDYISFELAHKVSDEARVAALSYTIPSDSQVPILVSATGMDLLVEDAEVQLSVNTVNQELVSNWSLQTDAGETTVAIVDAAHLIDNPFYLVPVYHQLSARGIESALIALRAIASEPTRIEAYNIDGSLIFVDAEGNGSLADPGDLIGGTTMYELYPILHWDGADLPIEFRYQPLERTSGAHVEIRIETRNTDKHTDWSTNVIDWLEISKK